MMDSIIVLTTKITNLPIFLMIDFLFLLKNDTTCLTPDLKNALTFLVKSFISLPPFSPSKISGAIQERNSNQGNFSNHRLIYLLRAVPSTARPPHPGSTFKASYAIGLYTRGYHAGVVI